MPDDRPNLLFMFADQLQAWCLGSMGHAVVKTPNLDALAADGVLFRQTYSTSPVCTPFRGCLMTGQYPTRSGCRNNNDGLPEGHRCLAHALNDGGYATSYVGKWHLYASGNQPIPVEQRGGFQRFIGYQCYNSFIDQVIFWDENHQPIEFENQHRTDATADLTIRRIKEIQDRPWAMLTSFQNPHYPLQPGPAFEAMYMQAGVHYRPNVQPCKPFTATMSPRSPRPVDRDPVFQRYGHSLEEFHRLYYAMVTQLDAAVGRIIAYLRRIGQYDQTVIVFTSDHGEMMGSHGKMNKGEPHEESSRIPLIVRTPNGLRRMTRDEIIGSIDFNPTILDWLNLPTESHFAGRSFAKLTEQPDAEAEQRTVFAEMHDWTMTRTGPWKLTTARQDNAPRSLYHLDTDPYELDNLLDDDPLHPSVAAARDRMTQQLQEWRQRVGLA